MSKTITLAIPVVLFTCATATMSAQQPNSTTTLNPAASADQTFVKEAARGGMAEVELGRLAEAKAANEKVKSFAQKMVTDHGAANDQLTSLAATKRIALGTEVDPTHKARYDFLKGLSGSAFDRAYLTSMLADHEKDVAAFRREASSGQDTDVKEWAARTLPKLEEHLNMVRELDRQVVATGN
jgi:putative membrane protein